MSELDPSPQFIACVLCGHDDTQLALLKWGHPIVTCRACNLTYVNPRVFAPETEDYFRGAYLDTMEENGQLRPAMASLYNEILRDVNTPVLPGQLLDVGCAMGHFMAFARDTSQWNVHGVECSPFAVDYGRHRWGLSMKAACDLGDADLPAEQFDACTLIEVIEHVPDPAGTLRHIWRALKPGGLLYLTTPNYSSFKSQILKEDWDAIIPNGHLYYFTAKSLGKMLQQCGFKRIADLTPASQATKEWEYIQSAGYKKDPPDLAAMEAQAAAEDAKLLGNGRGEGLRMAAFKPETSGGARASLRARAPLPGFEGQLLTTGGSTPESQRVFLVSGGRKHWVLSVAWLEARGLSLANTKVVSQEIIDSLFSGEPLG
jgi:2-polyprenyl-3-methyl-5-hydroxy-6-metoxy-1,4-benzoquinol methylase